MDQAHSGSVLGYVVIAILVLVFLARRMNRLTQTRSLDPRTLWILPTVIFLVALGVISAAPPRQPLSWIWIVSAFALGAALGWVRGMTIRMSLDPSTGRIMAQGSAMAVAFIVVLFIIRLGLRSVLTSQSEALGVSPGLIDAAFLSMTSGVFAARALEMGLRAQRIRGAATPAAGAGQRPS